MFRYRIIRKILDSSDNEMNGRIGENKVFNKIPKDTYYKVIHNFTLKDELGVHQIDLLLIRPNGLFCIEIKNIKGKILSSLNSHYWWTHINDEKYRFYNPIKQNIGHIKVLNKAIKNKYKINSLIVFASNNFYNNEIDNVINLNDFESYIINFNNNITLSNDDIDDIFTMIKDFAYKDI